MAGRDDDIGSQDAADPVHFSGNLLRSGIDEEGLGIDTADESDIILELGQILGAHADSRRLDGMNGVHTGFDEIGDNAINGAAGVEQHLLIVLLGHLNELLETGHDKPAEHFRRDKQVQLGAEVIAKEGHICPVTQAGKELLVGFHIEIHNMLRNGFHHLRALVHLDEVILHAEVIHNDMEETAPHAGKDHLVRELLDLAVYLSEVAVFCIGPGVVFHLRNILTVTEAACCAMAHLRGQTMHGIKHILPLGIVVAAVGANPTAIIVIKLKQCFRAVFNAVLSGSRSHHLGIGIAGPHGALAASLTVKDIHYLLSGSFHKLSSAF